MPAAPNTIGFNIGGGVQTITLLQGVLPTLTEPVIIDGFTETPASTTPQIAINGNGGAFNGLTVGANGSGSKLEGLVIQHFQDSGIVINGSSGNLVVGNYIGTDVHGTAALGNAVDGVLINGGSTANTIGGTATGSGNIISGNSDSGVYLSGGATSGNVVVGNLIGTDVHGTAALGNSNGVLVKSGRYFQHSWRGQCRQSQCHLRQ